MSRKAKIPWRNRNASGWWIAAVLMRFEYYDERKRDLNRRCLAWENLHLVKAKGREAAYAKALKLGRLGDGNEAWNSRGRRGAWRFEGLTLLLPVYDKLEDLTELLWTEHEGRSVRTVKSMVRSKSELPVFDDSQPGTASKSIGRKP